MTQIFEENNLSTDSLHLENSGFLGYSYSLKNAVVISQGSPETATFDKDFFKADFHNVHPVGFVPDSHYFKSLDSNLATFISKSDKPIVYMSFGTLVHIDETALVDIFEGIHKQSQYHFIWALTSKNLPFVSTLEKKQGKHRKLYIGTKLPQLPTLMREEIRVFVTHAGMVALTMTGTLLPRNS